MPGAAATLRHELIGLAGVFERNVYLVKRYIWWDVAFFLWTVANTLTIVFIAKGIEAGGGKIDVDRVTTILLCTHDMTEAEALADRVGILHEGALLALDTPAGVRERYGAETLEDAFMAATGRSFEDEAEEEVHA